MIIMDMSMNTPLIILSEYHTDVTNNPTELGYNFGSSYTFFGHFFFTAYSLSVRSKRNFFKFMHGPFFYCNL